MKRIVIIAAVTTGIMLLFFGSFFTGNIYIIMGMAVVLGLFMLVIAVLGTAEKFRQQANREEHDIFRFFKRKKKDAEEANRNDPE